MKYIKKVLRIFIQLACIIVFTCSKTKLSAQSNLSTDTAIGKIEIYESSAKNVINQNASIKIIGRGFTWVEGPVWVADHQMLLFSDVPNNKIYKWTQVDSTQVFLTPSGYTGTQPREGEIGSNGLALDNYGKLLICQDGDRQVARMNASLDSPKAMFTALTSNYNGKKYNSPNDIVAGKNGSIFFTDPIYGLPKGAEDSLRELKFEGVFKIAASGKTSLLIDSISRPNGIALSNDEKILYIASSDDVHTKWYAYTLDDNENIVSGGVLLDGTELKAKASVKQGADGFKIDKYGNIFSAGPDGINIISPEGKLIALIKIYGRKTSNCSFNEAKDVLYVTATDIVLKIALH